VFGNLPAGEIYIAPLEDSAEGVLVVDASFPGLLLSEPVKMTFEKGYVTQVEGGAGAEFLQVFQQPSSTPGWYVRQTFAGVESLLE
jgi:leucyl aminopeptidase (aminopeptidase T)